MNGSGWLKVILASLVLTLLIFQPPLFSQERFRKIPPYPEPLSELGLPEIKSASLSNGLALSVIQRTSLPIVSLRMIIFAGESHSPEKFPGIATLTARMLSLRTADLSSTEIEEQIEFIGGSFSVSTEADYSVFHFTFLEDYLNEAVELLSKMIFYPAFTRREIEATKRSMRQELLNKKMNPEFLAERQLYRVFFKDHPYQKILYNENAIRNLNQDEVSLFHYRYYRPNNSLVILTGDLDLQTASRIVSRHFNLWKRRGVPPSSLPTPKPNDKRKVCLVDLPGAKEATIYLGNIFSSANSEDIYPFTVLNQVLGGTTNSRLFMNLRESKGYAYWSFSDLVSFKNSRVFLIKAKVRPEVITPSLLAALQEIEMITTEEIPSFEIEQSKSFLIGNFPLQVETFDDLSAKASEFIAFNLGEEQWNRYSENIMLVNSEKVFEIARKYALLNPVIVIVGDKNIILDYTKELEEVELYDNKGNLQAVYRYKEGETK